MSKYRLIKYILQVFAIWLFLMLGSTKQIEAQDYGWWNTLVQWDGRSHWSEYLIYTPRFFGPNALPIPNVNDGEIIESLKATIGSSLHYSTGDNAQSVSTSLYIPITKDRVGLRLHLVPIEFYQMTAEERDLRFARDFDGVGHAIGDLYLSTWIQLTKPQAELDLLLTLNLKTASGSNREATRFTDGAGYSFDLSAGKNYYLNGERSYIRPYAQIGLYVWETNEDRNPQNDAFSYGTGISYTEKNFSADAQLAGYVGYKGNGDKPIVFRINLNKEYSNGFEIGPTLAFGFNDFLYNSYSLNISKSW